MLFAGEKRGLLERIELTLNLRGVKLLSNSRISSKTLTSSLKLNQNGYKLMALPGSS